MNKQKKSESKKSSQTKTVKGKLDISRSGMGFVIVEGEEKDVMVKPNDFGKAFHGDIVRVQVSSDVGRGKRAEGKVIDVAERKQVEFVGNIEINKNTAFFVAGSDKHVPDFYIPVEKLNGALDGERVVARLVKWDKADKKPQGEIVAVIKAADEADMAMKEILLDAGFPIVFEPEIVKEAAKLSGKISRRKSVKEKIAATYLHLPSTPLMPKILMMPSPSGTWIMAIMK